MDMTIMCVDDRYVCEKVVHDTGHHLHPSSRTDGKLPNVPTEELNLLIVHASYAALVSSDDMVRYCKGFRLLGGVVFVSGSLAAAEVCRDSYLKSGGAAKAFAFCVPDDIEFRLVPFLKQVKQALVLDLGWLERTALDDCLDLLHTFLPQTLVEGAQPDAKIYTNLMTQLLRRCGEVPAQNVAPLLCQAKEHYKALLRLKGSAPGALIAPLRELRDTLLGDDDGRPGLVAALASGK